MKKLIPLAVLEKIQPLIDEHRDLIKVIRDVNLSFYFQDADERSDFYFKVEHRNEREKHVVRYKPLNVLTVQAHAEEAEVDGVVQLFARWLGILDKYAKLHTVYDEQDPILKSYEEEFASYFEMVDEEADNVPFTFEKQLLLEQYLDWVVERLEQQKETASEVEKVELDEMVNEAQSLKAHLTQLSQNETVQGIAKIWAKARKYGLGLIKDLLTEFKKEGIKKLTEKALKGELSDWETISSLLS